MKKYYLFTGLAVLVAIFSLSTLNSKTSSENNFVASAVSQQRKAPIEKVPETYSPKLIEPLFKIPRAPNVKALAYSPDGRELWATLLLNERHGVIVYDATTGLEKADINLSGGGGVEIIFLKDGSKAYISQMETASVFEIDTFSKKILRILKTNSSWTKYLELSPDETKLYASNWLGNSVSEFDLSLGKLIRNIPTVKTPRGLYATKDGKYLYVAGFENGEIEKINLETLEKKILLNTGGAMRHIVGDEAKGILYVSDMGKGLIWKIDIKTDETAIFAKTDINPNTIALSNDKRILFVSCRGKNFSDTNYYRPGPEWGTVLVFNTADGTMLDAIVAGNQPTALSVSRDGTRLAFSNFLDENIEFHSLPLFDELKAINGGRSAVYKSMIRK